MKYKSNISILFQNLMGNISLDEQNGHISQMDLHKKGCSNQ